MNENIAIGGMEVANGIGLVDPINSPHWLDKGVWFKAKNNSWKFELTQLSDSDGQRRCFAVNAWADGDTPDTKPVRELSSTISVETGEVLLTAIGPRVGYVPSEGRGPDPQMIHYGDGFPAGVGFSTPLQCAIGRVVSFHNRRGELVRLSAEFDSPAGFGRVNR